MDICSAASKEVQSAVVEFDYTHFLCDAPKRKWTFYQAIKSIMPVFNVAWQAKVAADHSVADQFHELAAFHLSSQVSDEENIARLVRLAKTLSINSIKVLLPYEMEPAQLKAIACDTHAELAYADEKRESVIILIPA
ncbi:hypothetical protein NF212_10135 [Parasalinivibrio latis]|uniref:hypothetical protein n=1 Tax=Parasalinivibrio latis TaxID=2952610 RepID=UPI0030E3B885